MITTEKAVLGRIIRVTDGAVFFEAYMQDGSVAEACAYTSVTGDVAPGDMVLLNTTACRKKLGTGGVHFVITDLSREKAGGEDRGHMVKCRYTPVQHTVMSVEEQDSPYHQILENADSLEGLTVICGQLHSQLAVLCTALAELDPGCSICYIMPDYSCLPLGFSRLVQSLKDGGLVQSTVTCGQAFGGDYEAINAFSALAFARLVLKAKYAAVIPGPGNAGTGTRLGFGSLDMAGVINGAMALGARTVCIPRICYADPRERHAGLSHHTATMLRVFANPGVICPFPVLGDKEKDELLARQVSLSGIPEKHRVSFSGCRAGIEGARKRGITLSTMGRSFEEAPEFFYASSCAAEAAASGS